MENSKVFVYLESLEVKVRKLVAEHQSLKTELRASMEENKSLAIHAQNLEDEILNLNHRREESTMEMDNLLAKLTLLQEANQKLAEKNEHLEADKSMASTTPQTDSGVEKGELKAEIALLYEENERLTESLAAIDEHIKDIQLKSEALLIEFDRVQNANLDLTERNIELEQAYKQHVNSSGEPIIKNTEGGPENEQTLLLLEASQKELQEWKEKAERQEEALKNFINQEKNSKIVESIAGDDTRSNELKLRINEYIKEIDKCIAQLSD